MIEEDRIPVAKILKQSERKIARFTCTMSSLKMENPNSAGWKLAHIESVGLKDRRGLEALDMVVLQNHFTRLMTPSNMFVVPKKYAGLAELPEFCEQFRNIR